MIPESRIDELGNKLLNRASVVEEVLHATTFAAELREVAAALRQVRGERDWLYHNGGLLNEWATEWRPDKHGPLIPWLRERAKAALSGKGE